MPRPPFPPARLLHGGDAIAPGHERDAAPLATMGSSLGVVVAVGEDGIALEDASPRGDVRPDKAGVEVRWVERYVAEGNEDLSPPDRREGGARMH